MIRFLRTRERGLKCEQRVQSGAETSLPARERGLKLHRDRFWWAVRGVAPARGVD